MLFLSADTLYGSRHMDLIGSVQPLLDEARLGSDAMNQNIKIFLGFQEKDVKVTDVIQQLVMLIEVTRGAPEVTQQTTTMTCSMYSFLQEAICRENGLRVAVREENRNAFEKLCELRFVFCEGEFRECKQLAFHYEGKSGPYLFLVTPVLSRFSNLLKICGVKDSFDLEDYAQTLTFFKANYQENPLPVSALRTAKDMIFEIVSRLANSHDEDVSDENQKKKSAIICARQVKHLENTLRIDI